MLLSSWVVSLANAHTCWCLHLSTFHCHRCRPTPSTAWFNFLQVLLKILDEWFPSAYPGFHMFSGHGRAVVHVETWTSDVVLLPPGCLVLLSLLTSLQFEESLKCVWFRKSPSVPFLIILIIRSIWTFLFVTGREISCFYWSGLCLKEHSWWVSQHWHCSRKLLGLSQLSWPHKIGFCERKTLAYEHGRGASGKEPTCPWRRHKRPGFDPWVGKIPWRRAWQPTPVFFPGESHGQRSLAGYGP